MFKELKVIGKIDVSKKLYAYKDLKEETSVHNHNLPNSKKEETIFIKH